MKRRCLLLALCLLLTGAVVWGLRSGRVHQPSHQGRLLGEWLHAFHVNERIGRDDAQAREAIQAMGEECVPYLLHLLTNKPGFLKHRIVSHAHSLLVNKLGWSGAYFDRALLHGWYAEYGFRCLGKNGSNAIPDLVQALRDPDLNGLAAQSLAHIGSPAVPAMIEVLKTGGGWERVGVAGALSQLGVQARPALPALLDCQTNSDAGVRAAATASVALLQLEPDFVVPALTERLKDSDHNARTWAIIGLRRFGPIASNSAPAVARLLHDPHPVVRLEATNCIRILDPRALVSPW